MSTLELQDLQDMIRAAVTRVLAERNAEVRMHNAKLSTPAFAKLLVGICCAECLNGQAQSVLETLQRANFQLIQPAADEFKTRAEREKLVAQSDGVLLPTLGDDDATKMALGVFDEPVARLTLAALAYGKPVFAVLDAPYENQIKTRAPQLSRVWDEHRKLLQSYGIEIVEYSRLAQAVQTHFAPQPSTPDVAVSGKRVLISAREVEAAAKNGASLKLPAGAIVTPLARDRAKELNVKIH